MKKTQEGTSMVYRVTGTHCISMVFPHTTLPPDCEENHLPGRQKVLGGSHTLLRHPVQKQQIIIAFALLL